jgi:hypothetical protein
MNKQAYIAGYLAAYLPKKAEDADTVNDKNQLLESGVNLAAPGRHGYADAKANKKRTPVQGVQPDKAFVKPKNPPVPTKKPAVVKKPVAGAV